MRIIGHKGTSPATITFIEAIGVDESTNWTKHRLDAKEQIVGIYGSCNSAKNMRGLGFMVWKPLEHSKEKQKKKKGD